MELIKVLDYREVDCLWAFLTGMKDQKIRETLDLKIWADGERTSKILQPKAPKWISGRRRMRRWPSLM